MSLGFALNSAETLEKCMSSLNYTYQVLYEALGRTIEAQACPCSCAAREELVRQQGELERQIFLLQQQQKLHTY